MNDVWSGSGFLAGPSAYYGRNLLKLKTEQQIALIKLFYLWKSVISKSATSAKVKQLNIICSISLAVNSLLYLLTFKEIGLLSQH